MGACSNHRAAWSCHGSSRVLLAELHLAPSTLQLEITAADGRFVGRTDYAWEEQRLVGEFDGRIEYGRLLRPGQSAGDAVFEEERREDTIRDEGWKVVRWTWDDLRAGNVLGERIRCGLSRS